MPDPGCPRDVHKEQWYREYERAVTDSYLNYKYPRPYPAGTMYLFFDRKEYEVLGHMGRAASSCSLRTKGAFLVDAACSEGRVEYARVRSERGGTWKMRNPWREAEDDTGNVYSEKVIAISMEPGADRYLKEHKQGEIPV